MNAQQASSLASKQSLYGDYVPATGRHQRPTSYEGGRYLYCWHPVTDTYAYIEMSTKTAMPNGWWPGLIAKLSAANAEIIAPGETGQDQSIGV